MSKSNKFSPEVRERVVRMVQEHRGEYPSLWATAESVAPKIGCVPQTLNEWAKRAEVDAGVRSRQALADLCFQQQETLRAEKRDRYGRTVGRVECGGQDASQAQAAAGLAWAHRRYFTDAAIASAEATARDANLGLWADSALVPPWERRLR